MRLSSPIHQLKRQAKLYARQHKLPLHAALDQTAQKEGFRSWSHLSVSSSRSAWVQKFLHNLENGDMALLAARPAHGKTLFGLELAIQNCQSGAQSHFFTLEYTPKDVQARLSQLGAKPDALHGTFYLDCDDNICASYIQKKLRDAPKGTLVVVDYLQLLDQKRDNPELSEQLLQLSDDAKRQNLKMVLISQIHRDFDLQEKSRPDLSDIRLPNPVNLTVFNKACFIHNGQIDFSVVN